MANAERRCVFRGAHFRCQTQRRCIADIQQYTCRLSSIYKLFALEQSNVRYYRKFRNYSFPPKEEQFHWGLFRDLWLMFFFWFVQSFSSSLINTILGSRAKKIIAPFVLELKTMIDSKAYINSKLAPHRRCPSKTMLLQNRNGIYPIALYCFIPQ